MANSDPLAVIKNVQSDFALKLLRHAVAKNSGSSVVLSPISIAFSLATLYDGAGTETKKELSKVISDDESTEKIHQFYGSIIKEIEAGTSDYILEVANKTYINEKFTIFDEYRKIIKSCYLSEVKSVNFSNQEETANSINNFVAEKTHEKIKNFVSPGSLGSMTKLLLVNAVYFKGHWRDTFDDANTTKETFYVNETTQKEVKMMFKKARFYYEDFEHYQLLGMPYARGSSRTRVQIFDKFARMYFVLPKERFGLQKILDSLNGSQLLKDIMNLDTELIDVHLPKFETQSSHDLKEFLLNNGIKKAFMDDADFSGISSGDINVTDLSQKVTIEVSETGSEAAAATFALMCRGMCSPKAKIKFAADHPFLYFIVDSTGMFLFSGVYY